MQNFLPKPSGILRPYSLLTVEDQIAYQSAVNVIAERLAPKVRRRYHKEVFGHLYAGKTSQWFYRKWTDGYAKFNNAVREAYADGFTITASFDLTACYDSLDHGVLRHFLQRLGCDIEFCQLFSSWLTAWTATEFPRDLSALDWWPRLFCSTSMRIVGVRREYVILDTSMTSDSLRDQNTRSEKCWLDSIN